MNHTPHLARPFRMLTSRASLIAGASLLALVAVAACRDEAPTSTEHAAAAGTISMNHGPAAGGFSVQLLSRSSFIDDINATFRIKQNDATNVVLVDDPSDVVVVKVTLQPGGSLGWHTHHGPAIASVAAGELTIINARDCITRPYASGRSFVDPGQGNVHIGYNASQVETVVYVTYLDVPAGQGPTIPAQEPSC